VATLVEHLFVACLEGVEAGRVRLRPTVAPSGPSHKTLLEETRQVLRAVGKDLPDWNEQESSRRRPGAWFKR